MLQQMYPQVFHDNEYELNSDQNKALAFWNTDFTFAVWQQAEARRQWTDLKQTGKVVQ